MGEVYRARDTRLDRTVAIKVLPSHLSGTPEMRERFEREARTVSQLSHPNICALYDVGREGETGFVVMEYLEGETLAARIAKGAASARPGRPRGDTARRGARPGAPAGHRPSRREAGQRHADALRREAARLRAREGRACARRRYRLGQRTYGDGHRGPPDRAGHDPRHRAVHGARAARRPRGRRAQRHLRARHGHLRDGDRTQGVRGLEPGVHRSARS